jgi:hypothetical protein
MQIKYHAVKLIKMITHSFHKYLDICIRHLVRIITHSFYKYLDICTNVSKFDLNKKIGP